MKPELRTIADAMLKIVLNPRATRWEKIESAKLVAACNGVLLPDLNEEWLTTKQAVEFRRAKQDLLDKELIRKTARKRQNQRAAGKTEPSAQRTSVPISEPTAEGEFTMKNFFPEDPTLEPEKDGHSGPGGRSSSKQANAKQPTSPTAVPAVIAATPVAVPETAPVQPETPTPTLPPSTPVDLTPEQQRLWAIMESGAGLWERMEAAERLKELLARASHAVWSPRRILD